MRDESRSTEIELFVDLLSGDPILAMESAKKLIAIHDRVKPQLLIRILEDQKYRLWSRIAAAYVLGFLQYSGQSPAIIALLRITEDTRERVSLRSHAVEALSNLGAVEAIPHLERISRNKDESKRLQTWCIFALSELKSDGRSS